MSAKKTLFNRKGQAVVETALILPIIILVLMAIIDFGLIFNNYLVLTNASREGARSAAVGSSDVEIRNIVANMTSSMTQSKIRTTIAPGESSRKKGDEITITVEYDNSLLTPLIGTIIPNPICLKAKTVMRVE